MQFTFEALAVRELLSDIYSSMRSSLDRKGLHFDCESLPDDICLRGDRDKITQVLTNIILNAIKFTPEGGSINVSFTRNMKMGTVVVKDTGKGIRREDIQKVFDRFSQLEDIDYHSEGTGLGMTISKSIIEGHGGTIWIDSELDKGTTVSFTLPLIEKPHESFLRKDSYVLPNVEKSVKSPRKTISKKLLIVDDEISYRQAIADCVKSSGYESIEASNGHEALRMVREYRPVLVILDVMMRDLSGLNVCRMLNPSLPPTIYKFNKNNIRHFFMVTTD